MNGEAAADRERWRENQIKARLARRKQDARMAQWATSRGYMPAKSVHRCLHWLAKGQCRMTLCDECWGAHRWMDHTTCWHDEKRRRVLCCQPYHVSVSDMHAITAACAKFGLRASIDGMGFYGYGTVCILLELPHD